VTDSTLPQQPELYDPNFHGSQMMEIVRKGDKAANREEVKAVLAEWFSEYRRVARIWLTTP